MKPTYVIDGANFSDIEGFYDELSRVLLPGVSWGRNYDALNDVLDGGFGLPDEGFVLRWENSARSRQLLDHKAHAEHVRKRLAHHIDREGTYPTAAMLQRKISEAEAGLGATPFEMFFTIFREHWPSVEIILA